VLEPNRRFPIRAVRDALGLVRLLFGAHVQRKGRGPYYRMDPAALPDLGRELASVLDLAAKSGLGSPGYESAIARAEQALLRLRDLCDENEAPSGRELVAVAHARVRGIPLVLRDGRPPKDKR
jgi:hypothetical protein